MCKRYHILRGGYSQLASIHEVAKRAGVSTATVSRVISKKGYVSEKSKKYVEDAMSELEYIPSKAARNLARRKKFNLGMFYSSRIARFLCPNEQKSRTSEFYSILFQGMMETAKNFGFTIGRIGLSTDSVIDDKKYTADGIVLIGGDISPRLIEQVKRLEKPIVLVDQYIPEMGVDCVVSNGFNGAVDAVNSLIAKGARKIIHIHGPLTHYGFKSRYEGYVEAMKSHGLFPLTYDCDDLYDEQGHAKGPEDIIHAVQRAFRQSGKPEAIFTSNDPIAYRVMEALEQMGYPIPQEIRMVGFDDLSFSATTHPPLSSVKVFQYEMGSLAVDRMRQLLYLENIHPITMSLYTKYIERKSSE